MSSIIINPYAFGVRKTLLQILEENSLTTSLQLCLDAGDAVSYPGTGQNFVDRSGNTVDYFLGATSGSEASDPTFNGTAGGCSETEYFSFDGGDYFTSQAATTFDDGWHKNNGIFSAMLAFFVTTANIATAHRFLNNDVDNNATDGTDIGMLATAKPRVSISGTSNGSATSVTADVPNLFVVAYDESVPQVRVKLNSNAVEQAAAAASTNVNNAPNSLRIGARGNAGVPVPNGTRIYMVAAWNRYLSSAEMDTLSAALKLYRLPSMP